MLVAGNGKFGNFSCYVLMAYQGNISYDKGSTGLWFYVNRLEV